MLRRGLVNRCHSLVGCGPDGLKEDDSSQGAWEGRESERGSVCEGPASHTRVMTMMQRRGGNHHFFFPQGKRSEEDEGFRWDGRRNKVREGLNVPGGILRGGVDHLEHGKDGVLGVGALCPRVGGGGGGAGSAVPTQTWCIRRLLASKPCRGG